MDFLPGRVAVVTGAGHGIGRALARRCVAEGLRTVLVDADAAALHTVHEELDALGGDVVSVALDVADAAAMHDLAQRTTRELGAVHLLCHNAGLTAAGRIWEPPHSEACILNASLRGVMNGIRAFVPAMLQHDDAAHIVITASFSDHTAGLRTGANAAGRQALEAVSDSLRHDLAEVGAPIGVSVACPVDLHAALLDASRQPDADGRGETATFDATTVAEAIFLAVRENRFQAWTAAEANPRAPHQGSAGARCPFASRAKTLPSFDAFTPEFTQDRYAVYARYRTHDPVHWRTNARSGGRWMCFRHADVVQLLESDALGREPAGGSAPPPAGQSKFRDTVRRWMLFRDAPDQPRIRGVFARTMCPAGMRQMTTRIEEVARELIERLPRSGTFDLLTEFATLLPLHVIAGLFGLPKRHWPQLRPWSNNLAAAIDIAPTPEALVAADQTVEEITDVLRATFKARRRRPADDMITRIAQACDAAGEPGADDVLANCILLLSAGYETTANLIGNGMLLLFGHPDHREHLQTHPACLEGAIEEFLRIESPVQFTTRIVHRDIAIGAATLRAGQHVELVLGSANRDPEVFADPDRLDFSRKPNPHVSLGGGAHYCLGGGLARIEGRIAIRLLHELRPGLRAAEATPPWRTNVNFRGLQRLLVTL